MLTVPEPKHKPEYFIEGEKKPLFFEPLHQCLPVEDATGYSQGCDGFPFDDNTAGEELATVTFEGKKALGGHPDFYKYLDEMRSLYSAKHYQYATDDDPMINFRLCGKLMHKLFKPGINPTIAAALTLMSKQIVGVYEIVGEGKTNTIESLRDKIRDIGIYSVILQILVAETLKEGK